MSKPVMYLIANKGLGMSSGKLAAQVAHAAVRAYTLSIPIHFEEDDVPLVSQWLDMGETKIVLEARDTEHLLVAQKYIEDRGICTHLIIDEGRTEIAPHTPTVLGVQVVDKEDENVKFTFSDFKTYKDPKPEQPKRFGWGFLTPGV
jgi:PTH2 family peptidyl-tRNA hydrolase